MNKEYVYKRLMQYPDDYWKTIFKRSSLEFYKEYCSYNSPNVYKVFISNGFIHFYTRRYISNDSVSSETIFYLDGSLNKISPYERQYLQT